MRVYIAYKYRAVGDKNDLIKDLGLISGAIATLEHSNFILGRDIQKWHASSSSVFKTIPHILINILKSDVIFAYINSEVSSKGLPFEMFCAKLFRKPVILAKRVGINFTPRGIKPKQTIEFTDTQNLLDKIKTLNIQ
jgi:hypothetical protein